MRYDERKESGDMLAFQLIGATVILLRATLADGLPLELSFAYFLAAAILTAGGFAFSRARPRAALVVAKLCLCAIALPHSALPLWLVPTIFMELPAIASPHGGKGHPLFWLACAGAGACAALLLPAPSIPPFLGLCALSAHVAWSARAKSAALETIEVRARDLELELSRAESRRASVERSDAGQELLIKLEERDRIARTLHDELGHTITGSIMQLEAADLLVRDDPERAEASIGKASATLKEGLASIRASLKAIQPEPSALGLRRIQAMLDAFSLDYGREASLHTAGDLGAMPATLWRVIEANLQEALTNMLKHSDGTRFTCGIEALPGLYKAEFLDDGSRGSPIANGMGLDGMDARTREAGGTMIVDTSRGFSVIMLFKKGTRSDADTDTHRR